MNLVYSRVCPEPRYPIPRIAVSSKTEQRYCGAGTAVQNRLEYSTDGLEQYHANSGRPGFFRNHPFFTSNEFISVIKYWYQIKAVYDNEE